jgi:hypothetical protein
LLGRFPTNNFFKRCPFCMKKDGYMSYKAYIYPKHIHIMWCYANWYL